MPHLRVAVACQWQSEDYHPVSLSSKFLSAGSTRTFQDVAGALENFLRKKLPQEPDAGPLVSSLRYADGDEVCDWDDVIREELPMPGSRVNPGQQDHAPVHLWALVHERVLRACKPGPPVAAPARPSQAPASASDAAKPGSSAAPAGEEEERPAKRPKGPSGAAGPSTTAARCQQPTAVPAHITGASSSRRTELLVTSAKLRLERQVFVSHTGQDEYAKTFAASILKPALEASGLTTFMDFSDLQPGCKWPDELVNAAANSMVFVAVLSKQYYTRYWCMLELDLALNSQRLAAAARADDDQQGGRVEPLVIPVFYDDPAEVIPAQAMAGEGLPSDLVLEWLGKRRSKRAEWVDTRAWAANLVALKEERQAVRRFDRGPKNQDLQLAEQVAAAAAQHMPKLLSASRGVVGLEEQRDALVQKLKQHLGLWLWGLGGTGKTTLAKELFNHLSGAFLVSAMVELEKDDDNQIANCLAAALRSMGSKSAAKDGVAVLSKRLQELVKGRKVLYVLDNVWRASQLDALLPVEWGAGSTVIVTSRSNGFTDSETFQQVHERLFRTKVGRLEQDHCRWLFRWAAGRERAPPRELQRLEDAILQACGGMPLALRLAGSAVYGKQDKQGWQAVHEALKRGEVGIDSENKLKDVVTLSLSRDMDTARVSMFLDVATMLRGEPEDHALAVWGVWWGPGAACQYEILKRSSLVEVDEQGRLVMHDVLVALGRGIVLNKTAPFVEHYGTRVWVEDQQHVGFKQALEAGKTVVAAELCEKKLTGRSNVMRMPEESGSSLTSLDMKELLSEARILRLDGVGTAPRTSKLLWLIIRSCNLESWLLRSHARPVILQARQQRSASLPGRVLDCNLAVLELVACQLKRLPASFHQLSSLQELQLGRCHQLSSLPEMFGQLPALQKLVVTACRTLTNLPASFGQLSKLRLLDLSNCERLATLPESFGNLQALKQLDLSYCKELRRVPESFGRLLVLQWLSLRGCQKLEKLPKSFGELHVLQMLDISDCITLASMPGSFGQLSGLQDLQLKSCSKLTSLPKSFGDLAALQQLCISDCAQLSRLPERFGDMSALQILRFEHCSRLTSLTESFGHLAKLQQMHVVDCQQLSHMPESLGDMQFLQKLHLANCSRLTSLSTRFGQLAALQQLAIVNCEQLANLPDSFGHLPALRKLELRHCTRLIQLPDSFGRLATLETLDLSGCTQLAGLPDTLGDLSALQELSLWGCEQLEALPESFTTLPALQRLDLTGCEQLQNLPEAFGQLSTLRRVCLQGCDRLVSLPGSFMQLSGLHLLTIGCSRLTSLHRACEKLSALVELDLSYCSDLSEVPRFCRMPHLRHLRLSGCIQLASLPTALCQLPALRQLKLDSCMKLACLPQSLGQLLALTNLSLAWCGRLTDLPDSLGHLSALQHLRLRYCTQLRKLPETLGRLVALQELNLSECCQLTSLPESLQLRALTSLNLAGCKELNALPASLVQLQALQQLHLQKCNKLAELPQAFGQLSALRRLNLRNCGNLTSLPESFGLLQALQRLDLSFCEQLTSLPNSFSQLHALRRGGLALIGCDRLQYPLPLPEKFAYYNWHK